jgi:hypothetical protein
MVGMAVGATEGSVVGVHLTFERNKGLIILDTDRRPISGAVGFAEMEERFTESLWCN